MNDYYEKLADKLILRDFLAADRTQLANERTLLAYMRTALTLFIAGVSFIRFFGNIVIVYTGWIFIPVGIIVAVVGTKRYYRMKRPLDRLREKEIDPEESRE
jgi:putative membrane protein